ncbi:MULTISPECIES: hypothetical protein [unclassified Sphingopyxis]|jgi:hypothetical protein|uniref:hypothetical protein n=1 Tax=unclassified Sphingopyxis TaxID=2614943 RepID=UPI0007306642|nr:MULTISPECIES: hypothetical protein [unclassified Sphingopyxis]KTE25815.1 hypothetical protein ATE61_08780 [Sphingopyxis sp. H057]KTE51496.1 hypothetical protein ATE64_13200 [Sphingopyxis sp. H073]KTE54003.1 hypothetical protein ATE69_11275 [Sphingopyxis sp. H071]KTE60283.1 hypothetical protein ATE66_08685 [Sphingopyxis sp. H107]KTE65626.1 hypothetical protein ATE65_08800 [Sphingopyxis sp. H100]
MSDSILVATLVRRLESAGYERLPRPFRVASVEFDFAATLRGKGARGLDLVLVVDTATGSPDDRSSDDVRSRVEALSRALDVTGSRYTLTLVIVGAVVTDDVRVLSETCRVLAVAAIDLKSADGNTLGDESPFDDYIRILLPLRLPPGERERHEDGPTGTLGLISGELESSVDQILVQDLVRGSYRGEQGVRAALGKRIDTVLGETTE